MNKVALYIATSKDGFIADKHGGVDWLPQPQNDSELEDVGYNALMSRTDTILMGSNSYEQILTFGDWAWEDKHTYVFTSKSASSARSCISFTDDIPEKFMSRFKQYNSGKDIWLLGGAKLAQSFAKANLIDEIILTITPLSLGDGIPLVISFENFDLKTEKVLMDEIMQRHYLKI